MALDEFLSLIYDKTAPLFKELAVFFPLFPPEFAVLGN